MIQNQLFDRSTFAELTFDRADHGWQALLLCPLTIVQVCEDAHIPAVPDKRSRCCCLARQMLQVASTRIGDALIPVPASSR
jgi:hypothetical protein